MPLESDNLAVLSNAEREQIEGILFEFDSSWSPDALPKAANSIPPDHEDVCKSILEELVKIDIERRWSSGNGQELEDYLKQFPRLGTRETVSAALIQTEYEARKRTGTPTTGKEFQKRFPAQFEELQRLVRESAKSKSNDGRALASLDTSRSGDSDESLAETQDYEEPSIPREFGRYRTLRSLGQGAMGAVSLAHDTQLDREVALKTPAFSGKSAPELIERFVREAKTAANLRHPNICPVHDVGEIGGQHFITMAYIDGKPLSAFIGGDKPKPERQVALVIRKLALALEHAHSNGVVHRDLKPANIMIDSQHEPIVMDFGLAFRTNRPEEARVTQSGTMLGTPAYMSPEQVDADLDRIGAPTDIYSLGVIFYEFLTGQLPYEGSVASILGQIMTQEPPKPTEHRPDLDPGLEAICLKMMAKKIEDRYASMKDVAAALTNYLKEKTESGERRAESGDTAQPQKTLSAESGLRALFEATEQPQQSIIQQRAQAKAKPKKPTGEPKPNLVARWKSLPAKWKSGIATGIAAVVMVASIVLIFRPASGGTLKIEIEGEGIEVLVDGETIKFSDKEWEGKRDARQHTLGIRIGGQTLNIGPSGEIETKDGKVTLQLNGATLASDKFEIVRGKTTVIRVSFVKAPVLVPDNGEWISLFDGQTLAGWETTGDDWTVADGQIASKVRPEKARMAPLWSKQTYDDFVLRFQFRCSAGSTLILRGSPLTRKGYWVILKPRGGRFPGQTFDSPGKRGRLVVKPSSESVAKLPPLAAKQWQSCEVRATSHRLEVTIDGVKLVDVLDEEFRAGKIGFNFMELKEGLYLKNIQIRRLDGKPDHRVNFAGQVVPDGPAGELEKLKIAPGTAITAMALSPDGRHVAVGGPGLIEEFRVYDIFNRGSFRRIKHGKVTFIAYSHDGSRIASAGEDQTVRIWSAATGVEENSFKVDFPVSGLRMLSGHRVAILSRSIKKRAPATDNEIQIRDVQTGQILLLQKLDDPLYLGATRNGEMIAIGLRHNHRLYQLKIADSVELQNSRELNRPTPGRSGLVNAPLIFSPDGRYAVASLRRMKGPFQCRFTLWNVSDGKLIHRFDRDSRATRANERTWVAFTPDGHRILAGTSDGKVKLWDRESAKLLHEFKGHTGMVNAVAVAPDNRFAVTAGDSTIRVWRLPKLTIPQKQAVAPVPNPTAQRAAVIEFLKRKRAYVTIEVAGKPARLKSADDLPDGPFTVIGVYVDRERNLSDTEIARLAAFPQLRSLRIRFCKLNDDMLRHVGRLPKLELLDLINTGIGDAGLAHLKGLRNLKKLVLQGTSVGDAGLAHLGAMSKLYRLHIDWTTVTGNGLTHLKSLPALEWLTFGDAKFKEKRAAIDTLKQMQRMRHIGITGIKLTDAEKKELQNALPQTTFGYGAVDLGSDGPLKENPAARKVAELILRRRGAALAIQTDERQYGVAGGEMLPDIPFVVLRVILQRQRNISVQELEKLSQFKSLRQLDLYYTRGEITDDKLKPIGKLTSLTTLRLNGTSIGDAGMKHLAGLTNLVELQLGQTDVGDGGLKALAGLKNLKSLILSQTRVSDSGIGTLKKFGSLRKLYLVDTKVTKSGIDEIKSALKNCKVYAAPGETPPDDDEK